MTTPGELNRRAQLYSQLAAMIAAGLPLPQALEMAGRDGSFRHMRKTTETVLARLREGHTFTDSMKYARGWMPEFDITLLSVGESTGRLDYAFKQLARNYETRAQIIRDTISRLIITAATLHVFMLVFPIGLLQSFARGLVMGPISDCVPFIVEKIAVFGTLYGVIFILIFLCQSNRGERWRALIEAISLRIPLLGRAVKSLALARLASALEALTNAGVNVLTSWELASGASGSPRLRRDVAAHLPTVAAGTTPAEMVASISFFPELFRNLYLTGETTGKLDETLARLQTYYEDEGFRALKSFARLLNGLIYAAIAIMVGYTVISFWMNYYGQMMQAF